MVRKNKALNICLIILVFIISTRCKKDDPDIIVTDVDGNVYNTVKIGEQVWMKENLKTTSYADGTIIPENSFIQEGKNYINYGNIYSWSAATRGAVSSNENPSGVQGICPTDWHLPSDSEWDELANYLGGSEVAGGKMKEAGLIHWFEPNTGATNESGFTALPQVSQSNYHIYSSGGHWWSSTAGGTAIANVRSVTSESEMLLYDRMREESYVSVRCVRDY